MTIDQIRTALAAHDRKMMSTTDFPGFRHAAVLLLLFPDTNNGLSILLTVRTDSVETHKGQISCPGGMSDQDDIDSIDTALRETEEELAIARNNIEIVGQIDDTVSPAGFIITPVIGYAKNQPAWEANPAEVKEVITVPLPLFEDRKTARKEYRSIGSISGNVWFFSHSEHTIWGATAGIIVNLIETVEKHFNQQNPA